MAPHAETSAAHAAWLERFCFDCPACKARITPQTCAAMRQRPLLTEGSGTDGQREQLFRPAGCGEDCTAWLAQRDAPRKGPTNGAARTKRGTCGFCGRRDMALITGGLCGGCDKLRQAGGIVREGEGWRIADPRPAKAAKPATPAKPADKPAPAAKPLRPVGADPDKELLTPRELDALQAARRMAAASPAAPALSARPSGPAASSSAAEPGAACGGVPDDFQLFAPQPGRRDPGVPSLTIGKGGDIVIGVDAVRRYGLSDVRFVRVYWSPRRRALAIQPAQSREGAYSLLRRKHCDVREICAAAFLRHFGIAAPPRTRFPLTPGPGGLLVATIDAPAQPGGED